MRGVFVDGARPSLAAGGQDARVPRGCQQNFRPPGDPELSDILVEVAGTFAWTQGAISQAGWLDWLSQLPFEIRADLPDGTRALAVHVAPGKEDGLGLQVGLSDEELQTTHQSNVKIRRSKATVTADVRSFTPNLSKM